MTDPRHHGFDADFPSDLDEEEREQLVALASQLSDRRPIPRPGFRSAIRSSLLSAHRTHPQRARIQGLMLGYGTSGALLLVIAAAGLVGIGPFAA